jgi:hypothetical protein
MTKEQVEAVNAFLDMSEEKFLEIDHGIDVLDTFLQLIKTSDERSFSTEENPDIKYLVELPMTAEEYAFFTSVLKKI